MLEIIKIPSKHNKRATYVLYTYWPKYAFMQGHVKHQQFGIHIVYCVILCFTNKVHRDEVFYIYAHFLAGIRRVNKTHVSWGQLCYFKCKQP